MEQTRTKQPMSKIRKLYMLRLVGRCFVLLACVLVWLLRPETYDILYGMAFFERVSVLHLLWGIWVVDMLAQLMPIKKKLSIGSLKVFRKSFRPVRSIINRQALKTYIVSTTKSAYRVMILWLALAAVIGLLYYAKVIDRKILFLLTAAFYVCDLICVLIWCPFRLMMKTRCCTTCRIFNWDHLMMFTPVAFVPSFYTLSLFGLSVAVFCVWEACILLYPERFWEQTNDALKCVNCTDKLCTQYCQRLRP